MVLRKKLLLYNIHLRWPSGISVRLGSCRLEFDSKSGQTNDFKIGIQSQLPCLTLSIKGTVKNKPASLLVPLGKALSRIPPSWCGRQMAGNS